MIHDLLNVVNTTQVIFECQNCGRIAIQVGQKNELNFACLNLKTQRAY